MSTFKILEKEDLELAVELISPFRTKQFQEVNRFLDWDWNINSEPQTFTPILRKRLDQYCFLI